MRRAMRIDSAEHQMRHVHMIIMFYQLSDDFHTVSPGNILGCCIGITDNGINFACMEYVKCVFFAGDCRLCGIAPAPAVFSQEVSYFQNLLSVEILPGQSALADQLAGGFLNHAPETEAIRLIA